VFRRESRARCDAPIGAIRDGDSKVGVYKSFAARRDNFVVCRVDVVAGGKGGATGRRFSMSRELFDEEEWLE